MKTVIHKADSRGHANHGWLNTFHTFSFAGYYDPKRINFGALRVLNDDEIAGGNGFDMHPHENMEIITIPLEGALMHKDSMGNSSVISYGEVQVMSAGTGIYHSEHNNNLDSDVKLLQIWVFPNEIGVTPRYDQIVLKDVDINNKFQQIVSPKPEDEGVWIHQNAWFNIGNFDKGFHSEYFLKMPENGVYVFVINGEFNINGYMMNSRDGIGFSEIDKLEIVSNSLDSRILLMEVPMDIY